MFYIKLYIQDARVENNCSDSILFHSKPPVILSLFCPCVQAEGSSFLQMGASLEQQILCMFKVQPYYRINPAWGQK